MLDNFTFCIGRSLLMSLFAFWIMRIRLWIQKGSHVRYEFPSCLMPLCLKRVSSETIHLKMCSLYGFIFMQNHFDMKGFCSGLVLKQWNNPYSEMSHCLVKRSLLRRRSLGSSRNIPPPRNIGGEPKERLRRRLGETL